MTTPTRDHRSPDATNTEYIFMIRELCTFTQATILDVTNAFRELRYTFSRRASTASASPSSSSPSGRHSLTEARLKESTESRESYDRPCTWKSGEKQCWVVSELQPWNSVLSRSSIELYEHSWDELTLRGFHRPETDMPLKRDALRTSLLIHVLLRQHRCVTRVVLDLTATCIEMNIFWHGLQNGGAGIRCVKFSGSLSDQHITVENFDLRMWSHSVVRLPALHSLQVSRVIFDDDVAHTLGSYLVRTTTLKCITIEDVQAAPGDAITFLEYVVYNKTITRLILTKQLVKPLQSKLLAHIVQHHLSLEILEITGTRKCTPSAVLRAALLSSSLKSLKVRNCTILAEDIEAMAAALRRLQSSRSVVTAGVDALPPTPPLTPPLTPLPTSTGRLETLAFVGCPAHDPLLQKAYSRLIAGTLIELQITGCFLSEVFAVAAASHLRMNSRMRVLNVKNNKLCAASILILVRALRVNSTLQKMACSLHGSMSDVVLCTLFNIIRKIGASSRVHVEWHNPRPSHILQGGRLCTINGLFLQLDHCTAEDAKHLLEPLVYLTNVTAASVQCDLIVENAVVQHLVDALSTTTAVRYLELLLDWPENHIMNVLWSLEQNRSVSELEICSTTFTRRSAKALARLVEQNSMLNKISVDLEEGGSGELPQLRTLSRALKEALPQNRFLTKLALNWPNGNRASDFVIKDALRRNKILVNQAVHFIKGSDNKKDALAFETLQYSQAVMSAMCKGYEERDEVRAREQIVWARRKLALNYFIFTGVVKTKIVCHAHSKGKPTFDKLGKDVHAHICSYLSLTDVVDTQVAEKGISSSRERAKLNCSTM